MDLLDGRGSVSEGSEPNLPNSLDNCEDGNYGVYHEDESIDRIVIRSGYINGTWLESDLEAGKPATIVATVYSYNDGSEDYADFYYASNASNPTWQYIDTIQPTKGGIQELMMEYTIPDGEIQAVGVVFRHLGNSSNCIEGGFDDMDNLVFSVVGSTEPST